MTDAVTPLPADTRLVADASLRRRLGGRLLIGGSPLRFIRLSPKGGDMVSGWLRGDQVGAATGANRLARRLLAAGMLHPVPSARWLEQPLTVVIPVKDDQVGLERTVALLPTLPIVVVDDGSAVALSPPRRRSGAPVELVRRPAAGGPGVARNDGLDAVVTPLVAFVDAGVEVAEATLDRLSRWFADPDVVAVGPRISASPGEGWLPTYEEVRSPLDLGPDRARVGPGGPVTYLPTACLLARTAVVDDLGRFDPGLRYGEDVDLVWRLADRGVVRYDPTEVVHHPARPSLPALARQRLGYGRAAAPLAQRHPEHLAPVKMSGWSLAVWFLALAGRPMVALGVAVGTAVALRRKLTASLPDAEVEAALLTVRGHWHAGMALADAAVRVWWPITALAAAVGLRRPAALLVATAAWRRWRSGPGPTARRLTDLGVGAVDDVAYGTGVWLGALRLRSARALLPDLADWPGRQGPDIGHSAMNRSSS
ncbi:MAG: mycofactocin biosynthesis glycosyltransferase MftF [Acidimicrobiales bacterium]